MSEHNISQSGDNAKTIIRALEGFVRTIMEALNYLKKLPEYFKDLRKDITDGFSNLIQAQAEMEIYIKMSKFKSKSALINSENEAIEEFGQQLDDDLKEINKRYTKIHNDLNDQCKKRIREIDQHLLDIPDKFPKEMYSTFSEEIIPLMQNLISDASISYSERLQALNIAVEKSRTVISNFMKVRNDFFNKINNYEIPEKINETKEIYLPVWVFETKNKKNNTTKLHTLIPGNIIKSKLINSQKSTTEYKPDISLQQADFIMSRENKDILVSKINWKEDRNVSQKINKDISQYINKVEKKPIAVKTFKKIIDNSQIKFIKEVIS